MQFITTQIYYFLNAYAENNGLRACFNLQHFDYKDKSLLKSKK